MLFNSLTFIVFFAIVLALHYAPGIPWRGRKTVLLVASYLFYAAWNPPFVALLVISTVVDWFVARAMYRAEAPTRRKTFLFMSLGTNLGLLAYFKYGEFFMENFVLLAAQLGVQYSPPELDIVLPVGISFYTFQTLSYTIDVYRGDGKPWGSFLDFALFVSFFPQLVAGPIVRAFHFLPQCLDRRVANRRSFGWGLSLLVIGLFEKVFLADYIFGPISDRLFGSPAHAGFVDAWIGTFAFAGQIFCDFAGYSTCAIGVAMCLGFALPDNFRFPYAAIGFSDFWRRWHISLSQWLRDYLYISLGGNRKGPVRTYVNLSLTMLLGGLWHGASWVFVIWGALHGLYLVGERLIQRIAREVGYEPGRAGLFAAGGVTFLLVCVAWVFFRAPDLATALALCGVMGVPDFTPGIFGASEIVRIGGAISVLVAGQVFMRNRTLESVAGRLPWWILAVALAIMLTAILTSGGNDRAFIYFQF